MMFIPAVDLMEGRCVRLLQGDYARRTEYSGDPVSVARRFQDEGAPRLHLVDLDAAKSGGEGNIRVIERIAGTVTVPVEVGGGVRDRDRVKGLLDMGVDAVIVGTVLVQAPSLTRSLVEEFGSRMVAGIDAREGTVRIAGWTETSDRPASEVAGVARDMGFRAIIYTDIARDGTMKGPNLEAIKSVALAAGIPVIAAGGIGRLEDVLAVKRLEGWGVVGVIAGKAVYEGSISVQEACRALAGG